jgi:arabinofuranosyltransferase
MITYFKTYSRSQFVVLFALLVGVLLIILPNIWISDDAYISYRVIDNARHGFGLRWNISERVQVYTHPLWLLFQYITSLFTSSIPVASLISSITLTFSSLLIGIAYIAKRYSNAIILLILAATSQAFIDYATSGLENALGYMLIASFFALYLQSRTPRRVFILSVLASLIFLVRYDLVLIVIPSLALILIEQRKLKTFYLLLLGTIPAIAWEIFSIIYYGFLLPNTAYAKLNVNIPKNEFIGQGIRYIQERIVHDPVTVICIVTAICICFSKPLRHLRSISIGLIMYILYIIYIGGDFMAGRFLSIPFFLSILVISQFQKKALPVAIIIISIPFALLSQTSDLIHRDMKVPIFFNGIANEKAVYQPWTGLFKDAEQHDWAKAGLALRGQHVVTVRDNVGLFGYYAGPTVDIIDSMALADPLLARTTQLNLEQNEYTKYTWWRIGHFQRIVPEGYQNIKAGTSDTMPSKTLTKYYKTLKLIISGNIWDRARWTAILYNQFTFAPTTK